MGEPPPAVSGEGGSRTHSGGQMCAALDSTRTVVQDGKPFPEETSALSQFAEIVVATDSAHVLTCVLAPVDKLHPSVEQNRYNNATSDA